MCCGGTMRAFFIRDHIGLSFLELKCSSVLQLAGKLPVKAVNDMAFPAPVVCEVPWGVLDDSDTESRVLLGLPGCMPDGSFMLHLWDGFPIDDVERDWLVSHDHITFSSFIRNIIFIFAGDL